MDQTNVLPVSLSQLQTKTRRDPVLSRVYQAVTQGWIDSMEQDADLNPSLLTGMKLYWSNKFLYGVYALSYLTWN